MEENQCASLPLLRVILVGRSGSGKSATGNSILCQPAFQSRLQMQPVTKTCQVATSSWNGRSILVVDTAPIFDTETQNPKTYKDIGDCYLFSAPGPHVLLLVTQLGRFTEQDKAVVRRVKEVFGPEAMRYVVLLFTRREDLGDGSLSEFIAKSDNHSLRSLVRECEGRYCAFDNRATGPEQQGQLHKLMAIVETLERERQGEFLSNNLFFEAQLLLQRGGDSRENHERYLAQVRAQVAKHKQDLEKSERSCVLRVQSWMASHRGLTAFLVICILIFLAILISLCIAQGH